MTSRFIEKLVVFVVSLLMICAVNAKSTHCTIRIGSYGSESYGPPDMAGYSAVNIGAEIYITLFDIDRTGNIIPHLAKSWSIDETKKLITINLNITCHWSNGSSITAEQMAHGIKLAFDYPDHYFPGRELFHNGKQVLDGELDKSALHIHPLNSEVLEIKYTGPKDLFMMALSYPGYMPSPLHIYNDRAILWPLDSDMPSVTSGAYYPYSYVNNIIELRKNKHYCENKELNIDVIKFVIRDTSQELLAEFVSGSIDLIPNIPGRDVKTITKRSDAYDNLYIGYHKSNQYKTIQYLFINDTHSGLQDPRVKKAIKLLIDHEFYLSSAMLGKGTKLIEGYTHKYTGYNPRSYNFGPENYADRVHMAKDLMRQAGYSKNNALSIDVPVRNGHYFYPMTQALKGMLKQGYIDAKTRVSRNSQDYYTNLKTENFDLMFVLWKADFPDPSNYFSGIFNFKFIDESWFSDLNAKFVDSFLIEDKILRFQKLAEIENKISKSGNIIPLYSRSMAWAFRSETPYDNLSEYDINHLKNMHCS